MTRMKKIISALITIIILSINFQIPTMANEFEIEGLEENLEQLWFKNYFTQEQVYEMEEQLKQDFTEYFMSFPWNIGQTIWKKPQGLTQEEMLLYHLDLKKLNPDNGIKVFCMNTELKYAKQYEENECFDYLLSDIYYWAVQGSDEAFYSYSPSGELIDVASFGTANDSIILLNNSIIGFLRDIDKIKFILAEKEIKSVYNFKIFSPMHGMAFLYIESDRGGFLIKLKANTDSGTEILPEIKLFELYTVSEVLESIETASEKEKQPIQDLQNDVLNKKNIYVIEADSLRAEGLLNGNENGLDLLKPLTRIEAAAMLLRAMGESEDSTGETVFSDVPLTHWGNGAANKAHSLGIIKGIGDNQFAPDRQVSAEQFSTMVLRAANLSDFDWKEALNILIKKGIITSENSKTMDFFTRGDMAKIIYEARKKGFLN